MLNGSREGAALAAGWGGGHDAEHAVAEIWHEALRGPTATHDVAIVGLGYVGLPTAVSFTRGGARVVGIDVSAERLDAIRAGAVDILDVDRRALEVALRERTLDLSGSPAALRTAGTVLVCVPTPVDHHLVPDLGPLARACATVVDHALPGQLIILTSTTYVGTTRELLVEPLRRRGFEVGEHVSVAFSPERIDPGNDRFPQDLVPRVVGGVTPHCTARAREVLSIYARSIHEVSSPEAAEATKLVENTFRAVNIALVNELADVSRDLGVDVMEVIDAASTKPYGFMPFTPGPGVGGHCIPCDPHYLLWQLKRDRRSAPLIEQAMWGIAERPRQVVDRVRELLSDAGRALRGAEVLMVGVAYKPGVADLRESPALEVIDRLLAAGARVGFHDPLVPALRLSDGTTLRSLGEPPDRTYDLVILNTLHPSEDYGWVTGHRRVLDTTYRFDAAPHRAVL